MRGQGGLDVEFVTLSRENVDELAPALSRLDLAVRGRQVNEAYWRWCYLDNPAGPATAIIATCEGEVVGKHGCVPMRMTVAGHGVTAYLMEGLSLLPEHRNWNALRGLLHATLTATEGEAAAFGFGFATPLPTAFHRLMGLETLERLPIFVGLQDARHALQALGASKPLSRLLGGPAQLLLGVRTPRASGATDLREITAFDASFDALWNALEPDRGTAVVKDASYLNWRYTQCPSIDYGRIAAWRLERPEGMAVWRVDRSKRHGFLLELLAREDRTEVLEELLGEVLRRMAQGEVGLVSACFPPHSAAARILRKAGFNTWASRLRKMSLILTVDPDWVHHQTVTSQPWQYTFGDWLFH